MYKPEELPTISLGAKVAAMENQMGKNMESEVEAGLMLWLYEKMCRFESVTYHNHKRNLGQ